MKRNRVKRYLIFNFCLLLFLSTAFHNLREHAALSRLSETTAATEKFRSQSVDTQMQKQIQNMEEPGEVLALYWLEQDFETKQAAKMPTVETLKDTKEKWEKAKGWDTYNKACKAIWDDLEYFPIPEASNHSHVAVTFENSWMFSRSYKGERGHEGTDIMPTVDKRGYYPVISMTDGVVRQKGWLELGGWRLGIETEKGAYFYYAHMDSYADIEEGDIVHAGDLLGYMGDTGYGKKEGTKGNFPVHLHVGIYLNVNGKEISINPYPALKYLESRKISCVY